MKRFLLYSTFVAAIFFMACKQSFIEVPQTSERNSQFKTLYISIDSDVRTALPVISDTWEGFTFNLTVIQNPGEASQKAPVEVFNGRSYSELCVGFTLEEGKYRFILEAYKNGQKGLSGEQYLDLSMGNTSLTFVMYPVTGAIGSASVKVYFPNDGTVKKVKAAISSSIFVNAESVTTEDLNISIESGSNVISYSASGLPSGSEQYVLFWFYDANGSIVYSGTESLIIVGGCVSKSEITLTADDWHTYLCTVTLNKDGEGWLNSGKTVSLVNKNLPSKIYNLKAQTEGKYSASVAEGLYYIYVNGENSNIEFNSINQTTFINYYTVQLDPAMKEEKIIYPELMDPVTTYVFKRCTMIPVSGAFDVDENYAVVQSGQTFEYKIQMSSGYKLDDSGLSIKENGIALENPSFDTSIYIDTVTEAKVILVEGIIVNSYTITYYDTDGSEIVTYETKTGKQAYWFDYSIEDHSYSPVENFSAETEITLPTILNVRKTGSYFDAWVDADNNVVKTTAGVYRNLVLYATWKSAPTVNNEDKTIYANGFNLLIKSNDTKNSLTYIFVDYNGDGIQNEDDFQIKCTNISTGKSNDFSGYTLRAGTEDGTAVNSDFTFTMTGGTIAAIYGLGKKTSAHPYTSRLNISGTAVIGSVTGETTVINDDESKTTTASAVKGIMLETFSDERVNIVNQMSTFKNSSGVLCNYSIICVTPYEFDENVEHTIAYIKNSSYATFNNFTCWTDVKPAAGSTEAPYKKCLLGQKNIIEYSVTRTLVQLTEDAGINLPKPQEVSFAESGEFSFDDDVITAKCSVFSISVENGTFRCNERLTITEDTSDEDKEIENTLTYMAQPTPTSYVESFEFGKSYVYMQIISSGNQLTPEIASGFLSQLCFKRDDEMVPIIVTVNLEKVPAEQIYGEGDGAGGSEFKYFNGSFYKRVAYASGQEKKWTDAYNAAKTVRFNGLKGYLMTISSLVENNYVYDTFYKISPDKLSWAGGSTYVPKDTIDDGNGNMIPQYDQDVYTNKVSKSQWIWQCGPEAGVVFFNTPTFKSVEDSIVTGVFQHWNNATIFSNEYTSDITKDDYPLRGNPGGEPNGPTTVTIDGVSVSTTSEPCLQFLAGKLAPTNGKEYYANGYWNNIGDSVPSSAYKCTGYIIEFSPYETIYGKETANYTPIRRTATY